MTADTEVVRSEADYFRIVDHPSGIRKNNPMFECLKHLVSASMADLSPPLNDAMRLVK
jgi:hypothetical protein